jgi:hypothetical protein
MIIDDAPWVRWADPLMSNTAGDLTRFPQYRSSRASLRNVPGIRPKGLGTRAAGWIQSRSVLTPALGQGIVLLPLGGCPKLVLDAYRIYSADIYVD